MTSEIHDPSFKELATALIREALRGRVPYLILRGVDDFARTEGDIDVLVPRNRAHDAVMLIADLTERKRWAVAGIADIGYISQLCLVSRWGAQPSYRAIKVDIWNGLSWWALGKDPLGDALFAKIEQTGEIATAGIATFLQKFLYPGFLRERDRARIFGACDISCILAFCAEHDLRVKRADIERGKLGKMRRWRLRAASAGVQAAGVPIWFAKVALWTLWFRVFRSSFRGSIIILCGGNRERRFTVTEKFRSLVVQSGFPAPLTVQSTRRWTTQAKSRPNDQFIGKWTSVAAQIRFHVLMGETVIVDESTFPPQQWHTQATAQDRLSPGSNVTLGAVLVHLPSSPDRSGRRPGGGDEAELKIAGEPLQPACCARLEEMNGVQVGDADVEILISRLTEESLRPPLWKKKS